MNPSTLAPAPNTTGLSPVADPAGQQQLKEARAILHQYAANRITDSEPVDDRPPLLVMNGTVVATRQNLLAISGPSKGGKTAITSLLCAAAIQGPDGYDGCPAIQLAPNPLQHAVLHFDTEQSRAQHFSNFKMAVLKRAGLIHSPDYFGSYNLLDKNIKERKLAVEALLKAAHILHKGIHLVVIDGIADFIKSVNDEEETNRIVAFFRQLAVAYNTTLVLVVHLNPGSEKERGHLGSELQRKCESVLTIEKKKEESTLTAKYLRQGDATQFGSIKYQFDTEKGYHAFARSRHASGKQLELEELAKKIFVGDITSAQATERIMQEKGCKLRNAGSILGTMKKTRLLEWTTEGSNVIYRLKNAPKPMQNVCSHAHHIYRCA
jgi:hypothetical protein